LIDLKDDVAKIFAAMAEAYQALTDPERRDRYVKLVKEGGGTQADAEEVARVVDANNSFQRALFFVDKQQFKEAEGHAKRAIELEPNDPEHISVWCWIEGNRPERRESQRFEDLIAKLDRVLADAPKNERARYYRAMMLKWGGRVGDAMRDFREIADANPRHTEAMREVRLHSMRNERDRKTKDDGSGSLLGRFVKKK
jgi:tetratricopeptide (TPR) repeat protein